MSQDIDCRVVKDKNGNTTNIVFSGLLTFIVRFNENQGAYLAIKFIDSLHNPWDQSPWDENVRDPYIYVNLLKVDQDCNVAMIKESPCFIIINSDQKYSPMLAKLISSFKYMQSKLGFGYTIMKELQKGLQLINSTELNEQETKQVYALFNGLDFLQSQLFENGHVYSINNYKLCRIGDLLSKCFNHMKNLLNIIKISPQLLAPVEIKFVSSLADHVGMDISVIIWEFVGSFLPTIKYWGKLT